MTCFGIGLFMSLMLGFIKLLGSVGLYIFLNQFRKILVLTFLKFFPLLPFFPCFWGLQMFVVYVHICHPMAP